MTGRAKGRVSRRLLRRSTCLVALGLASSLGAAFAVAATTMSRNSNSRSPISIRATPTDRTVMAGGSANFSLRLGRGHRGAISLSGQTAISVAGPLPTGAAVSFSPRPPTTTNLSISTGTETPPGTYLLRLRAHRPHRDGSTTIRLTVSASGAAITTPVIVTPPEIAPPDAFAISGSLPGELTPGTTKPLDLTLTNREPTDISITGLSVTIEAVRAPHSDQAHPCGVADFAVKQLSGALAFSLAALSTTSLSKLGVAETQWPSVSMLNLPLNQDGCKQASLTLAFTGTAMEAP